MFSRLACLLALSALMMTAPPSGAQTTTQDDVLAATFLPGWQMKSGHHMTGLRLDLAPGWKTYWRAPGDAGIPPRFDWSGSTNLASVILHWPAPAVFHTNGYQTFGYKNGLLLPIEIVPVDPAKPVMIRATVELGICQDICMPATVTLATEAVPPGAPDPAIAAALKTVPLAARQAGLTGATCAVEPIADGLRITARLDLPKQPGEETVAFESADTSIWVSESTTRRSGNTLTAITELVAPSGVPFALDRSGLTLTVIHAKGAVELTGCPAP